MKNRIAARLQIFLLLVLFGLSANAYGQVSQQELYNFGATNNDGSQPSRVVQGADGWLYGATFYGGNDNAGILFKMNTNGTGYTIIHSFNTNDVADGAYPSGDIALTPDGWLCGTTQYGGANGAGTVYKISTNGNNFTLVHSFAVHYPLQDSVTDGPRNIMQGSDGALYGIIEGETGGYQGGVFKVNPDSSGYAEIHSFVVNPTQDLYFPFGGLVEGSDGALYGTCQAANKIVGNDGGIFKLSLDGSVYQVLYGFGLPTTAAAPYPADWPNVTLIQGKDGNLYGTTQNGGENSLGTIFSISTNGTGYTQVYSFTNDGFYSLSVYPNALVQGADGSLYGTTSGGGYIGQGDAFRVGTNGMNYEELYRFSDGVGISGSQPDSGMIIGHDGLFYGVTSAGSIPGGGNSDIGTVYSLFVGTGIGPQLNIRIAGASAILTWPTNTVGYTLYALQSTTNLASSAAWTTNLIPPLVIGTNYLQNIPMSGAGKFYRLIQTQ